jgi:uncharacterized membrane protein YphA (DoxX/SURF4 family)
VLNVLLVVLRAVAPEPLQQVARFALGAAGDIAGFVLGAAWVPCVASIAGVIGSKTARFVAIVTSIYVATSFLGFEVGKAAHDAQMRQFFVSSGLPVWFMYAVMAVESVAAVGLLFARTRAISAVTLFVVMLGAIGTHLRNGDAVQDSYDAFRMLMLLVAILLALSAAFAARQASGCSRPAPIDRSSRPHADGRGPGTGDAPRPRACAPWRPG